MSNITILPEDGWKEISTESSGTFSLTAGGQHCIYDGVPPDSLVGHRYVGKSVDYLTGATESLYVKVSRACFAVGDVGVPVAFAGVQIGQAVLKGGSVWYNSENDPVFALLPHSTAFSGVTYPLLAVKYPSLVTPVMPDETGSPHPYQIVADYTGA